MVQLPKAGKGTHFVVLVVTLVGWLWAIILWAQLGDDLEKQHKFKNGTAWTDHSPSPSSSSDVVHVTVWNDLGQSHVIPLLLIYTAHGVFLFVLQFCGHDEYIEELTDNQKRAFKFYEIAHILLFLVGLTLLWYGIKLNDAGEIANWEARWPIVGHLIVSAVLLFIFPGYPLIRDSCCGFCKGTQKMLENIGLSVSKRGSDNFSSSASGLGEETSFWRPDLA